MIRNPNSSLWMISRRTLHFEFYCSTLCNNFLICGCSVSIIVKIIPQIMFCFVIKFTKETVLLQDVLQRIRCGGILILILQRNVCNNFLILLVYKSGFALRKLNLCRIPKAKGPQISHASSLVLLFNYVFFSI